MISDLKTKSLQFYNTHETRIQTGFFLGGFLFDILTSGPVDDTFMLVQQVAYLILIGGILSLEHLTNAGLVTVKRGSSIWEYRSPILHFALGSVLSLYSIFFFKSASIFTSIVFVIFLLVVMVANELPRVQKAGIELRWALWVLCVFSFFSVIYPVVVGFVGWIPFFLSALTTAGVLYLHMRWMMKVQKDQNELLRAFVQPGIAVIIGFALLYVLRLVPPVPLVAQDMGIYHQLEKREGKFILSHQKPWWRFWETGDQTFLARSGDQIYFFAKIISPGRFSDQVVIHWLFDDPRAGWISSDKVRMQISGGREQGFRGFAVKKNYQPGHWRVQIETTDSREIGRLYFNVEPDTTTEERVWNQQEF